MNEGTNNEIDLLLRKLGRRDGADALSASPRIADDGHLDADELNAYAEGSLPPAARALCTEHLAECPTCRKIVTQLSLASGPTVLQKQPAAATKSLLKTFLGSFLHPLSWRYAVPTLAAIAILAVTVVVLRRQSTGELVARNEGRSVAQSSQSAANGVSEPKMLKGPDVDAVQTPPKQPDSNAERTRILPQQPEKSSLSLRWQRTIHGDKGKT